MDIYVETARKDTKVRALLKSHGWRLADRGPGHLTARHPKVHDEQAARTHLYEMGLLTSPRVRIEFGPSGD